MPGKPIGDSQQDDREGKNDVVCDGGERVQAYIVGADEGQKGELPEKERLEGGEPDDADCSKLASG